MVDLALGLGVVMDELPGEGLVVVLDVLFQPGMGRGADMRDVERKTAGRSQGACFVMMMARRDSSGGEGRKERDMVQSRGAACPRGTRGGTRGCPSR